MLNIERTQKGALSIKSVGLGVFLVVVIGAITLVVLKSFMVSQNGPEATLAINKPIQPADSQTQKPSESLRKVIPAEVKSYVGTIVSVNESSLTIEAQQEVNYLTQDTRLTAEFTPTTLFMRVVSPKIVRADQDIASLTMRETISSADLKVGDQVVVVAEGNAKDKVSFKVVSVEVRIVE